MTRDQLQALIEPGPDGRHADYRLFLKQGDTSTEFFVSTPELLLLTRQLQQVVPEK
jgi:hypothetical protein